ncbi:MAG: hypothetical protein FWE38_02280 [Firmicutes bacterium]|nr:hypothetical protein [Bacillota bacterium]
MKKFLIGLAIVLVLGFLSLLFWRYVIFVPPEVDRNDLLPIDPTNTQNVVDVIK